MKNRPNFTNTIEEWSNFFIPLNDGVQLAARAWLPTNAIEQPVPAILEYIPYRKRDGTAIRDEQMHPYWAAFGYACVRVDIRGSGESDLNSSIYTVILRSLIRTLLFKLD